MNDNVINLLIFIILLAVFFILLLVFLFRNITRKSILVAGVFATCLSLYISSILIINNHKYKKKFSNKFNHKEINWGKRGKVFIKKFGGVSGIQEEDFLLLGNKDTYDVLFLSDRLSFDYRVKLFYAIQKFIPKEKFSKIYEDLCVKEKSHLFLFKSKTYKEYIQIEGIVSKLPNRIKRSLRFYNVARRDEKKSILSNKLIGKLRESRFCDIYLDKEVLKGIVLNEHKMQQVVNLARVVFIQGFREYVDDRRFSVRKDFKDFFKKILVENSKKFENQDYIRGYFLDKIISIKSIEDLLENDLLFVFLKNDSARKVEQESLRGSLFNGLAQHFYFYKNNTIDTINSLELSKNFYNFFYRKYHRRFPFLSMRKKEFFNYVFFDNSINNMSDESLWKKYSVDIIRKSLVIDSHKIEQHSDRDKRAFYANKKIEEFLKFQEKKDNCLLLANQRFNVWERVKLKKNYNTQGLFYLYRAKEGISGFEKIFNGDLKENYKVLRYKQTSRYRELDKPRYNEKSLNGNDIYLSINYQLQDILNKQLLDLQNKYDFKNAYVTVCRPSTGEILALGEVNSSVKKNTFDDMFLYRYEVGSVLKTIVLATVLDYTSNNLYSKVSSQSIYNLKNYKNFELPSYSIYDTIKYSINTATARFGFQLSKSIHKESFKKFGLYSNNISNIGSTISNVGLKSIPMEEYNKNYNWARFFIGQAWNLTLFQILQAYQIIANDGIKKKLTFLSAVKKNDKVLKKVDSFGERVISANTTRQLKTALEATVEGGTAKKAKIKGLNIAGKTGTSQKSHTIGGDRIEYWGNFIGFVPTNNPKFLVSVVIDDLVGEASPSGVAVKFFHHLIQKYKKFL